MRCDHARRIRREALVKLRHGRGLSMEAAAARIGISSRTLSRYENGEVSRIEIGTDRINKTRNLRDIAMFYGLDSWEELLDPVDAPAVMHVDRSTMEALLAGQLGAHPEAVAQVRAALAAGRAAALVLIVE